MSDDVKRKLLYLYFGFQCFVNVLNIIIFFAVIGLLNFIYALGAEAIETKFDFWNVMLTFLLIISVYLFYMFISYKATFSTNRIIHKHTLTLFEKISLFTFTVIIIFISVLILINSEGLFDLILFGFNGCLEFFKFILGLL